MGTAVLIWIRWPPSQRGRGAPVGRRRSAGGAPPLRDKVALQRSGAYYQLRCEQPPARPSAGLDRGMTSIFAAARGSGLQPALATGAWEGRKGGADSTPPAPCRSAGIVASWLRWLAGQLPIDHRLETKQETGSRGRPILDQDTEEAVLTEFSESLVWAECGFPVRIWAEPTVMLSRSAGKIAGTCARTRYMTPSASRESANATQPDG